MQWKFVQLMQLNEGVFNMGNTEENLKTAFAGESQVRNKYDYWAKQAKKENLLIVEKFFKETALNEMQHAKDEFKLLKGIGSTVENLKTAISGEHYENTEMYVEFVKVAEEEGQIEAAKLFKQICNVEVEHENRYKKLLKMVEDGTLYKRLKPIRWKCSKCGFIHSGISPPDKCPSCDHEYYYYEPECMCFGEDCEICQ